jgi:hypothetical protein
MYHQAPRTIRKRNDQGRKCNAESHYSAPIAFPQPISRQRVQPLPAAVLEALSYPGIDAFLFPAVLAAFGSLPVDGQMWLANELIGERLQYLIHLKAAHDRESTLAACQKQLKQFGAAAAALRKSLHRAGTDHQPWNRHPAIDRALPHLFRIAAKRRPNQIWDGGLTLFDAMLAVAIEAGAKLLTLDRV